MQKPKLRFIQNDCVLANFSRNLDQHRKHAEQAIEDGMDAVVFPELSLSGYNVQDAAQDMALHIQDPALEPLRELSREITIICGGIELSDDYGVYNSALFFEDGRSRTAHRKIYLPAPRKNRNSRLRRFLACFGAVSSRPPGSQVAACADVKSPSTYPGKQ